MLCMETGELTAIDPAMAIVPTNWLTAICSGAVQRTLPQVSEIALRSGGFRPVNSPMPEIVAAFIGLQFRESIPQLGVQWNLYGCASLLGPDPEHVTFDIVGVQNHCIGDPQPRPSHSQDQCLDSQLVIARHAHECVASCQRCGELMGCEVFDLLFCLRCYLFWESQNPGRFFGYPFAADSTLEEVAQRLRASPAGSQVLLTPQRTTIVHSALFVTGGLALPGSAELHNGILGKLVEVSDIPSNQRRLEAGP